MISNKEKKRRQRKKELNSLRNKMGKNIVWFDSLDEWSRFKILFIWKREKFNNRETTEPYKVKVRMWGRTIEVTKYPSKLKHFINKIRASRSFKPQIANMREAAIDILLKK